MGMDGDGDGAKNNMAMGRRIRVEGCEEERGVRGLPVRERRAAGGCRSRDFLDVCANGRPSCSLVARVRARGRRGLGALRCGQQGYISLKGGGAKA